MVDFFGFWDDPLIEGGLEGLGGLLGLGTFEKLGSFEGRRGLDFLGGAGGGLCFDETEWSNSPLSGDFRIVSGETNAFS